MKEQSAEKILATTIERIKDLVDVSVIIGDPVKVNADITLIPVSKVTYGFASGGSDFPSKNNVQLFGGGGGAGVTINPVAFLVINKGEISVKHLDASDNAAERLVNMIPEMYDKVTGLASRKKTEDAPVDDYVPPVVTTE